MPINDREDLNNILYKLDSMDKHEPMEPLVKVKVTQWCSTLCYSMDYTVHGILQARILEWVTVPSPGDLPNPGIEPRSPALQADSLPSEPLRDGGLRKTVLLMTVCSAPVGIEQGWQGPWILLLCPGRHSLKQNLRTLRAPPVFYRKIHEVIHGISVWERYCLDK